MPSCPACRTRFPDGARHCPHDGEALLDDAAFSNVDPELKPGDIVGEYQIEGKIGEGGFGAVYAAVHPLIGKRAALKTLHRQHSSNPQIVARFIAEAKAVNQIRHRNIIDIFSFGNLPDGRQYFLMELLEGRTLEDHFQSKGKLSLDEALPILRGIARALDAAHAKGIAHRDLKPENVFLVAEPDGGIMPKLLDFGVAKLSSADEGGWKTRTGVPVGTPYYMSPEQARGLNVDHRTDVYALGVMCHQLLTGHVPFDGLSVMDVLMQHSSKAPPRMSGVADWIAPALDEPVLRMLAKDPMSRPASAGAAIDQLEGALSGAPPEPDARRLTTTADLEHAETQPPSVARTNHPSSLGSTHEPVAGSPPAGGSSRTTRLAALGGVAAAVVAVALWIRVTPGHTTPPPAPLAAPPSSTPPPLATAEAGLPAITTTPPAATSALVVVMSTPPGATVSQGATPLGRAPGPFALPVGSSHVTLTVSSPGYRTGVVDIVPAADATVQISLKKIPTAAPISPELEHF